MGHQTSTIGSMAEVMQKHSSFFTNYQLVNQMIYYLMVVLKNNVNYGNE